MFDVARKFSLVEESKKLREEPSKIESEKEWQDGNDDGRRDGKIELGEQRNSLL